MTKEVSQQPPRETAQRSEVIGCSAEDFVTRNMGMVKQMANKYAGHLSGAIDYDDAVQEASLGLLKAYEDYEPSRGAKPTTYAYHKVRGTVRDFVRGSSHLGRSRVEDLNRVSKFEDEFEASEGRKPTTDEVSRATGLKPGSVESARSAPVIVSGYTPIDAKGHTLFDLKVDSDPSVMPEEKVLHEEECRMLKEALSVLDGRSRRVVEAVYFEGAKHNELAVELNLSETRISQLHKGAIKKLRASLQSE